MSKSVKRDSGEITQTTVNSVLKVITSDNPRDFILGFKAPTGIGKSTKMIYEIQTGVTKFFGAPVKIFVVQPTIAATLGLYRYMKKLYANTDITFGYAANRKIEYNSRTNVVYCTDGHLENVMLRMFKDGQPTGPIDFCHILVLDEAHRGNLAQDSIIGLWKTALKAGINVPKLVFISATLDMEDIGFSNAPVVIVDPKPFPIKINYAPREYSVDSKDLYRDTAIKMISLNLSTEVVPKSRARYKNRVINFPGYDVWICFCPGRGEVTAVADYLESQKEKVEELSNVEIMPVYGEMGANNYMDKMNEDPDPGVRRIIISTNLAEASLTIPYVSKIFDTLTEKYIEATSTGGERLTLGNISRSSAEQRAGRTGRLLPGEVYRFTTRDAYENKLLGQRVPEIKRIPLHTTVIKFLGVGLDPGDIFSGRIDEKNLKQSKRTLDHLTMVVDSQVTEMGIFATKFQLSIRASAILWHWIGMEYDIFTGVVLACLIDCCDGSPYFFYKYHKDMSNAERRIEQDRVYEKHFRKYSGPKDKNGNYVGGKSDLEVLIVMWHYALRYFGHIEPHPDVVFKWCKTHSLNSKKIIEVFALVTMVSGKIGRLKKMTIKKGAFSPAEAIRKVTPILKTVFSDSIYKNSGRKSKNSRITYKKNGGKTYQLDRSSISKAYNIYGAILAIRIKESGIEGASSKNNFITLSAPVLTEDHFSEEYSIDYGDEPRYEGKKSGKRYNDYEEKEDYDNDPVETSQSGTKRPVRRTFGGKKKKEDVTDLDREQTGEVMVIQSISTVRKSAPRRTRPIKITPPSSTIAPPKSSPKPKPRVAIAPPKSRPRVSPKPRPRVSPRPRPRIQVLTEDNLLNN
jgi:HrpA-like RNA helicase